MRFADSRSLPVRCIQSACVTQYGLDPEATFVFCCAAWESLFGKAAPQSTCQGPP